MSTQCLIACIAMHVIMLIVLQMADVNLVKCGMSIFVTVAAFKCFARKFARSLEDCSLFCRA